MRLLDWLYEQVRYHGVGHRRRVRRRIRRRQIDDYQTFARRWDARAREEWKS